MSDEAIAVSTHTRADYSAQQYVLVVHALQAKAEQLSANSKDSMNWTARDVERALWSAEHDDNCAKSQVAGKPSAKRKRSTTHGKLQ